MNKQRFRSLLQTFQAYASKFLSIKEKSAKIIPLKFNAAQNKIHAAYEQAVKDKRLLRFIVLKARQEGVSTYFVARVFHRAVTSFNRKSKIVGHEQKAANNLLDIIERFYAHLPEPLKPELEHSNEKKISFLKLKSEISVASADVGEGLERSTTLQDLIITEVAFWRDQKNALLALLQTVDDNDNTLIVIESTANGIGDEFYNRWKDAKEGRSGYIPIFLAWFDLPEYSLAFPDDKERTKFANSVTDEEIHLGKTYHLTLEQLNWRRATIENKCGGDAKLFEQEYPSNDVEAFLTSGRPVFRQAICRANYEKATEPLKVGNLEYRDKERNSVRFVESPSGYIRLWQEIQVRDGDAYRFAAGADVAEGLEQGNYSALRVIDRKTHKVCLTWHGHIDPDLYAEEQHKIQLYLGGNVYFCTEKNNHGLTTIVEARKLGVNQYYESDFSKGYEIPSDQLGFRTGGYRTGGGAIEGSKTLIINLEAEAIRDGSFEDMEKEYWDETMTFVRNAQGKMQAQGKDKDPGSQCFDDRVIAQALMLRCDEWMPVYKPPVVSTTPKWFAEEMAREKKSVWEPGKL